jgi:hypothetical protein
MKLVASSAPESERPARGSFSENRSGVLIRHPLVGRIGNNVEQLLVNPFTKSIYYANVKYSQDFNNVK